jgi:hypothetical protein
VIENFAFYGTQKAFFQMIWRCPPETGCPIISYSTCSGSYVTLCIPPKMWSVPTLVLYNSNLISYIYFLLVVVLLDRQWATTVSKSRGKRYNQLERRPSLTKSIMLYASHPIASLAVKLFILSSRLFNQ